MRCYDFDKEFQNFIRDRLKDKADEYKGEKGIEKLEAKLPELYDAFLNTPFNWLGNKTPVAYFDSFDNAAKLVRWMEDYMKQRVPVPDILLDRISGLGTEAEAPLIALLNKEPATVEMKMTAVTLLREIESTAPMELYIAWQAERESEEICRENDLADNALESLQAMGEGAVPAMKAALSSASDPGREALLTVLCNYPGDQEVVRCALDLLERNPRRAAVLSDALAKLGDNSALPLLLRLAGSVETPYLDYIELRCAIEQLGGDAPEREFDEEDPDYEAVRSLQ